MNKKLLETLYLDKKLSSFDIAKKLKCSANKINYWIKKHDIKKRNQSDATYHKRNPLGDPFEFIKPKSLKKMFTFGLGLGLYWGEGTKMAKNSIRLGNTDPDLIKSFINFLILIYKIDKNRLRFQLLSYDDLDSNYLLKFWSDHLGIKINQFYKTTILKRRGTGTYTKKMKHGVLLLYFNNLKLRNLIISQIADIKKLY